MKVQNFYVLILHFAACTTKCGHVRIGAVADHKHSYIVYINIKSGIADMVTVRTLHLMPDKWHRRWYLGVSSQISPVPMTALTG